MPVDVVLQLRGVHKTYAVDVAPVRALRGVDLTVAAGEFVALMGPSGGGKSTLLHVAAGLEPADEGEVVVAGQRTAALGRDGWARLRRRHVGLVFQGSALLDGMTAEENVALAALIAGSSRREARRRAGELLDLLGLLDKVGTTPDQLSGGQRQRLAIARALANRPTLLLADEPTGALDSEGSADVLGLFARLHAGGQTILLVTHDPKVAETASRVLVLRDGQLARQTALPRQAAPA